MTFRFPSIKTQLFLTVLIVFLFFGILIRLFFISQLDEYSIHKESMAIEEKLYILYEDNKNFIPEVKQKDFDKRIEEILELEKQDALTWRIFKREIEIASLFILGFIFLFTLISLFILLSLITYPLQKLQYAVRELSIHNLETSHIKESPYSPINDVIIAFNNMLTELSKNQQELIRIEKESAWRDMARILAHEIKNPLTPIALTIDRFKIKMNADSPVSREILLSTIKIIEEELAKLLILVTEFSQFARLPEPILKERDLITIIKDEISSYPDENIILTFNRDNINFECDASQMKQVFANLIQNAILMDEKVEIKINISLMNEIIKISIIDNGPGIDSEHLNQIFEPYFTTRQKGTGLGLSIVNRIIILHGGSIEAFNIENGAKFIIQFPINGA